MHDLVRSEQNASRAFVLTAVCTVRQYPLGFQERSGTFEPHTRTHTSCTAVPHVLIGAQGIESHRYFQKGLCLCANLGRVAQT